MKRWWLIAFLIVFIAVFSVYFFIPTNQSILTEVSFTGTQNGIERILLDKKKIQQWWPGTQNDIQLFSYKNYHYKINIITPGGIKTTITNGKDSVTGIIQALPAEGYAILLRWTSPVTFSFNPVKRILQYLSFVAYKKNIAAMLTAAKGYFEKEENIYGFKVRKQVITDTTMVALKKAFNHYPSTTEIYKMVGSLKQFIIMQGGEEKDFPLLNIHTENSFIYDVMVALPTKKAVDVISPYILKRMIPGNILTAEIKGGSFTAERGEQQLSNYANDNLLLSPAIPFQSLVTNREIEKDTTKWITRLSYPVF